MTVRRVPVALPKPLPSPPPARTPTRPSLLLPEATKKVDGGLTTRRRTVCLGIDSSATGWALTALSTEDDAYYSWLFKSPYKGALRLLSMASFINAQLESIRNQTAGIETIVMEGYSFGSINARELIGEIGGITKLSLLRFFGAYKATGYPYYVSPQALKKFVTGSGASGVKKDMMLLSTYKKWGVEFRDNNLCDSFGAAQVAKCLYTGETKFDYERAVIAKVKESTEWNQSQILLGLS